MRLIDIFLQAPMLTQAFALAAALLAFLVALRALWNWWRWRAAARQLSVLREELTLSPLANDPHGTLYRKFPEVQQQIRVQLEASRAALPLVDELLEDAREYHDAPVARGGAGWEEIRNRFLARRRRTVSLVRAAAAWAVLLGLAGTVLGFTEALPHLRGTLEASTEATADQPVGETTPPTADDSAPTGGGDRAVLAVFWIEPQYRRLAGEVELLGNRWLVPLIETPQTLLDETLKDRVDNYFRRVIQRLNRNLTPLIEALQAELEGKLTTMSTVAESFATNIQSGEKTLTTFASAVEGLGEAAEKAVPNVVEIVNTSKGFLEEVEKLHEAGTKQLESSAKLIAEPAARLADSATLLAETATKIGAGVEAQKAATEALAADLEVHREAQRKSGEELWAAAQALSVDVTSLTALTTGIADVAPTAADAIETKIEPLVSSLGEEVKGSHEAMIAGQTQLVVDLNETLRPMIERVDGRLEKVVTAVETAAETTTGGHLGRQLTELTHSLSELKESVRDLRATALPTRAFAPSRKKKAAKDEPPKARAGGRSVELETLRVLESMRDSLRRVDDSLKTGGRGRGPSRTRRLARRLLDWERSPVRRLFRRRSPGDESE